MTVQAQTDKRFRRSSRPARRGRGAARRRLRLVRRIGVAAGLGVGGYLVVGLLSTASFLVVDDIVVRGNDQLSEAEVLALVSGLVGENILTVDLEPYRRRFSESPWLRGWTLRRILPSTVDVQVTERRPVAIARFGGRLYLIDEDGTLVDRYGPRFAEFDLPIIDGLAAPGTSGTGVDPDRMALAARLLEQLAPHAEVFSVISQIDVSDPYDAVVLLNDDPVLLHLGGERFVERLRFYAELAPTLRARVADLDDVDLRFGHRVVVRGAGHPTSARRAPRNRLVGGPAVARIVR